jgi:hypothetical protein
LFISVGNLKIPSFYVVIGDLPMLLYGVGVIYFYLENRRIWLMGSGIASGFIRPGLPELSGLLLAFPFLDRKEKFSSEPTHLGYVAAVLVGSVLAASIVYYMNDPEYLRSSIAVRCLSGAIMTAYVTVGLYYLFRHVTVGDAIPKVRDLMSGLTVIAVVVAILWIFAGPTSLSYLEVFRRGILLSVALPAISPIAHVVYFGPGILLVILLWPKVADAAGELGTGFVAMLGLGVCLSIFSESRIITAYIPGFILALTLTLAGMKRLRQWGFVACAVLCVLFSKAWMLMAAPDPFFDGPQTPMQRYFMNFAPWMSPESYLWQGLAILAASAVLIVWVYGSKIQESNICMRLSGRLSVLKGGKP